MELINKFRINLPWCITLLGLYFISYNMVLAAGNGDQEQGLRRLLGLVEYIGGDYSRAIEGGKIKSQTEYSELREFIQTAQNIVASEQTPEGLRNDIQPYLVKLAREINELADKSSVIDITDKIKEALFEETELGVPPAHVPDLAKGKMLYESTCASCHGQTGRADGPLTQSLSPPPRNFFDESFSTQSSPGKIYNTLFNGVQDTAMVSFAKSFSTENLWDIAFYVSLLPLVTSPDADIAKATSIPSLSFRELTYSSNQKITKLVEASLQDGKKNPEEYKRVLYKLRSDFSAVSTHAPEKDLDSLFSSTFSALNTIEGEIKNEKWEPLHLQLIDFYLKHIESLEPYLRATRSPYLSKIEELCLKTRQNAKNHERDTLKNTIGELKAVLTIIRVENKNSPTPTFWSELIAALLIIVREGIEALLVIAGLLAVVNRTGMRAQRKWVHLGWITAIFAGLLTYGIFEYLLKISGASRESFEGYLTLCALLALYYTGFWLLSAQERVKWDSFIKSKTAKASMRGAAISLFGVSFFATYREAAETVLFYQALLAQGNALIAILLGLILGIGLLVMVSFGIFYLNTKLPLKSFFKATSILMLTLSIILLGKTVQVFVRTGYIHPTPVNWFGANLNWNVLELFGIYPIFESIFAQICLVLLTVVIYYIKTFSIAEVKLNAKQKRSTHQR